MVQFELGRRLAHEFGALRQVSCAGVDARAPLCAAGALPSQRAPTLEVAIPLGWRLPVSSRVTAKVAALACEPLQLALPQHSVGAAVGCLLGGLDTSGPATSLSFLVKLYNHRHIAKP